MAIRTVYDTHSMLSSSTHSQLSIYTHAWLHSHTEEYSAFGKLNVNSKLIAYVLDAETLTIKDLLEFEEYEFQMDTEFANKSRIVVSGKPNTSEDDFIVCQSEGSIVFTGVVENYTSTSDSSAYTLTMKQAANLFDRFVFIAGENLVSGTGIEDFIAKAITDNWISSGDAILDRTYMTVTAVTHTPVYAKVSTIVSLQDGCYNLKTFLGNAMEYYDIYVGFDFTTPGALHITIYRDTSDDVAVDATVTDVTEYTETYSVDALAKLNVLWNQMDGDTILASESRTYYLLSDRTITTDGTNPNRASGSVRSMVIEADTENEMYQSVLDEFASNSYSHKISFLLAMESKLYDYTDFYPGHDTMIKTKSGIRNSIVTGLSISSSGRFAQVVFGKLKVTLIEKLRDRK